MRTYYGFGSADVWDGGDQFSDPDMARVSRPFSRRKNRSTRKRSSHSKRSSRKRVSFVTKSGHRVSFMPKSRKARRSHRKAVHHRKGKKRPYPSWLKKYMFKKKR